MNAIIRHAESLKIEVNGEMFKPLTPRGVLAAIDYAKAVYEKHELFWENKDDIYTFDRSPQIRAIETSEAIVYGLKKIGTGDTYGADKADNIDLESRIIIKIPDNRLDVANFLQGHAPHEIGAAQSYIDCIELDPDEAYMVAARMADYVLSNVGNDHVISISHHVPMMLLLYVMGIIEKDVGVIPNLSGFSYAGGECAGEKYVNFKIYSKENCKYFVGYDDLKKISDGKVKKRLKAGEKFGTIIPYQ